MRSSSVLFFVGIAFVWGMSHGMVFRIVAFWRRAGYYVRNDEYRVGFFAMSIVVSLFLFRQVQTYVISGHLLWDGLPILTWALVYCWGLTFGFSRSIGPPYIDKMTNAKSIGHDSVFSPITGVPDE